MNLVQLFDKSILVSSPPAGALNFRVGSAVEGPGGRWVPCASAMPDGTYLPCIYEVGAGRRQVCAANRATHCAEEALTGAIELAAIAAA